MADVKTLHETVARVLGGKASKIIEALGEITVECLPENYLEIMTTLRDHADLHFESLVDLCGVDYSTYKKRTLGRQAFCRGEPAGFREKQPTHPRARVGAG